MTEDLNQNVSTEPSTPRWVAIAVALLAVASLVSLGVAWNASKRAETAEQALAAKLQPMQESDAVINKRIEKTEASNAQLQAEVGVVADKLKVTQGELSSARRQTKQVRDQYAKSLEQMEAAVRNELAGKASADDVNTRMGALSGDVNGVRNDLEAARKDLGLTRSEFGTLIARNHEDIEKLRRLGERDYFEFTISRKGAREKVGSVLLELRGTNVKKSSFTLALYVDDKRFEKKNRSVNEPIYFYTRGTRQPFELVVNEVAKDKVIGYLSSPKGGAAPTSGGK